MVYVTAEAEDRQYEGCYDNNVKNMRSYMASQGFVEVQHNNTSDPTFINKRFMHLMNDIYIYQSGW